MGRVVILYWPLTSLGGPIHAHNSQMPAYATQPPEGPIASMYTESRNLRLKQK